MRSVWSASAIANATLGERCSIQQSRKYGLPRNSFGGAGPRSKTRTLVRNSTRQSTREIASLGGNGFPPKPGLEVRPDSGQTPPVI